MSDYTYAGYKPEDRRDYKGNIMLEPPNGYWGAAGQLRYVEDAIDRELRERGGLAPQGEILANAQARGEVALCEAFRAHPARSRRPTDYPRVIEAMAKYIRDKMTADVQDRTGAEPKNLGALESMAETLARIWATGVLKMARL